ncbi:bacteriocin immunity protein [Pseudomonas sp. NPDC087029]|uniref:bacteriocin immunity protein n=1 Tax=Pseudomonas sp. NPDC087029 TaxID=3364433 RepID=UPI0038170EBF
MRKNDGLPRAFPLDQKAFDLKPVHSRPSLEATGTSAWQDCLLEHFIELAGHPEGSDLIYNPVNPQAGCAEGLIASIIGWQKSNGLPLFKDE